MVLLALGSRREDELMSNYARKEKDDISGDAVQDCKQARSKQEIFSEKYV